VRATELSRRCRWRSWLLTKDHKRIAMLYLISITIFFAVGGLFALGIRLELMTPQGDFVAADTYNKLFTLHGVVMIFFFLIPSIPATLGNFLIPISWLFFEAEIRLPTSKCSALPRK
jgi:cytochrome c oxidase subunit 1